MTLRKIVATVSVGVSVGFLTVVQVKEVINTHIVNIPEIYYKLLLILGLIGLFTSAAIFLYDRYEEYLDKHRKSITYKAILAKNSDLPEIHDFCDSIIPNDFASLRKWRERYEKNNNIIYVVKSINQSSYRKVEKIVGGFSLFPISEEVRKMLEREKIFGIDFLADHILSPTEKPDAIYIAWVVAKKFYSKAFTLSLMIEKLKTFMKQGVNYCYARPSTDIGLRLIKLHKFTPVSPTVGYELNRIYKIDASGVKDNEML